MDYFTTHKILKGKAFFVVRAKYISLKCSEELNDFYNEKDN